MQLETERLILRDVVEEDWKRLWEYQSDPLYLRYNSSTEGTKERAQEFVGWFLDHQKENPRIKFQLAITLKTNGLLIGNCGIRMDDVGAVEADLGYELDPKHWNCGYATEAAHAMVDFGFQQFSVHRVWAACVADNVGSAHVMEKLGMKFEGHFRENRFYRERWWDSLYYAVLEEEWQSHKNGKQYYWLVE